MLSTPERGVLELLDELPGRKTFHQVDVVMDGLVGLSPKRTSRLLRECRSVKVKRLFLWLAERHGHPWIERLDRDGIDLGKGKRMLVRAGGSTRNTRSRFRRTSMPVDERYRRQVELLVRALPHVAQSTSPICRLQTGHGRLRTSRLRCVASASVSKAPFLLSAFRPEC